MTEEKQSPTEEGASLKEVLDDICHKIEGAFPGAIAAHEGFSADWNIIYLPHYHHYIGVLNVPNGKKNEAEKFCESIFDEMFYQGGLWGIGYSVFDEETTKEHYQKDVDIILKNRAKSKHN